MSPHPFWRAVALSFETCRRHARACLVVSAPFALLLGVAWAVGRSVSLNVDPTNIAQGELAVVGMLFLLAVGVLLLVGVFVYAPTIGALSLIGSTAIEGDDVASSGAFRPAFERALETVGAFVLTIALVAAPLVGVGVLTLVVGALMGAKAAFVAFVLFGVALLVPAVYVVIRYSLAIPVVIREGLGPVDAMRRSWQLVNGAWWWVAGVYAVVGAVSVALFDAITMLGGFGGSLVGGILTAAGAAVAVTLLGVASGVVYSARTKPHVAVDPAPVVAA